MIHTRLQLDPTAEVSVRWTGDAYEIVVLDPASEASAVISLSTDQLDEIQHCFDE